MFDFNDAITINPNDAVALYCRGLLKYRLGDKGAACSEWSKSMQLGNADAYDLIMQIFK